MAYEYKSARATDIDELKGKLPSLVRAHLFFAHHRRLSFFLGFILVAIIVFLASFFNSPDEAEALPWVPIVIAVGALILGGIAVDSATGSVSEMLRTGVNGLLDLSQTLISSIASADGLIKSFDELIDGAYPILQGVFTAAVIPIAYVALAIFLVVGLVKIFQAMGQNDTGVDLWRIMLVFIMFGFAKIIIDNSFVILIGIYEFFNQFISGILSSANMAGAFSMVGLEDNFENMGLLLVCLIVVALVFLVTLVVVSIIHFVLIVRAIQIYVYTCFAPIPLACMVSESGRSIATGFLKSYIAVLFSGAIIALLISMFAYIAGVITVSSVPSDAAGTIAWCCELLLNLIVYVAFGWSMLRSGAWAREFVGLAG